MENGGKFTYELMSMAKPTFSIIIPLRRCNAFLDENINALLGGSYQNFEIIVLPDKKEKRSFSKTRIIPTGAVGPAEKRDIGARNAKAEILAFIDDDAYPSMDWLKNAHRLFSQRDIAAVCGPGVTPPSDSLLQKVSGVFSATLLGGGPYGYRFIPQKARQVDDYPSMNFLIQTSDFWKVGGFDTAFWPGEDTKLCLDITKKIKKKIVYDPGVLVYHHRRAIFAEHLGQNGRYGLHRGHFARILPDTSFRISYFLPSFLLVGFFALPIFFLFNKMLFTVDAFLFVVYLFIVAVTSISTLFTEKNILIAVLLAPTIIITHLYYGLRFIQGYLFTGVLTSRLIALD